MLSAGSGVSCRSSFSQQNGRIDIVLNCRSHLHLGHLLLHRCRYKASCWCRFCWHSMDKFASVRICAYNVLAQNLATSRYFPSGKQALKVAKRFPLLRQKFQAINADIICVSEAFSDVVDILRSLDYEVRYIQRHNKTYGNAIAWRGQQFEVEREATATLNDCADAIPSFPIRIEGSGVSILREDFITENIAMFMQFRLKQHADSHLCVCSSHLYWDPSKDPVKVAQAQMFDSAFASPARNSLYY